MARETKGGRNILAMRTVTLDDELAALLEGEKPLDMRKANWHWRGLGGNPTAFDDSSCALDDSSRPAVGPAWRGVVPAGSVLAVVPGRTLHAGAGSGSSLAGGAGAAFVSCVHRP